MNKQRLKLTLTCYDVHPYSLLSVDESGMDQRLRFRRFGYDERTRSGRGKAKSPNRKHPKMREYRGNFNGRVLPIWYSVPLRAGRH